MIHDKLRFPYFSHTLEQSGNVYVYVWFLSGVEGSALMPQLLLCQHEGEWHPVDVVAVQSVDSGARVPLGTSQIRLCILPLCLIIRQ